MQQLQGRVAGFFRKSHTNKLIGLVVALALMGAGYALIRSSASGFFAASESESGTLSGNAAQVSDSTASGGKAVQFNAPAPPPPGGSSSCPLPKYPTPSCAGRLLTSSFSNTVGSYTASTANQVIDNWHITGTLDIRAKGVIIRNSQIDGTVSNDGAANTSFTISDSTVGAASGCSQPGTPSLWGHDFAASQVVLRGHQDAVDMGGNNVTVQDSFLQPCYLPGSIVGGDGYHTDGVQDLCSTSCSNLLLTHNTIDARAYYNGVSKGNSALNLGSVADGSHLANVTLDSNLFMGGGYSTDLRWSYGVYWVVISNAWVQGTWTYDAISTEGTCASQTWATNKIVTIDSGYNVTSTVKSPQGCVQ